MQRQLMQHMEWADAQVWRAVLALPLILPGLITGQSSPIQPFVWIPLLIHIFAWAYLIHLFINKYRARTKNQVS